MNTEERPDDVLLRRYLLGERIADAEQDRVERSYFENDQCLDRLFEVEDDLIDTYIRGGLSPAECARFERHFLSAKRRRHRYEAMRAIAAGFFRPRPPAHRSFLTALRDFFVMQSPMARAAMAGVCAVTFVAAGLLCASYLRLSEETARTRALLATARPARAPASPTFALRPGLLRSEAGAGNQVRVAPDVEWLTLRLETPVLHDYSQFSVALSTAPGEELLRQNRLLPAGNAIDFRIAAGLITPGQDYTISLAGLKPGGQRVDLQSYAFHVAR